MEKTLTIRNLILETAKKLFAEKGFSETKISDIATAVGVTDSAIYEHFQNKEDILLLLPVQYMTKFNEMNKQNMRGLTRPDVKLKKLLWNYLEFFNDDPDYANVLIFELRSNRNLYKSEGYKGIKAAINIILEVIQEGKDEGLFDPDLSTSMILNLIFGTLDHVFITWLVENKPDSPLDLFDEFIELIDHGLENKTVKPKALSKKQLIINAAVRKFTEIGFKKTRIQEITRLAGVSDATFYKYFHNKEDLLFHLSEENTNALMLIQKQYTTGIKDPEQKLIVLIKTYLDYLEKNKEYGQIIMVETRLNKFFYKSKRYNVVRKIARMYYDTIIEGVKEKQFRASTNAYLAIKMIFGLIDHVYIRSAFFGKPEKTSDLSDVICNLILKILKA